MLRPNYQHPLHKNDLFPIFLSPFLKIQITFSTQVQESENGKEARRPKRTRPVRKYTLCKYKIEKKDFNKLADFFHDKAGQLYSFLLLDIHNFEATGHNLLDYPQDADNAYISQPSFTHKYFLVQNFTNNFSAKDSSYAVQRVIKTPVINSIKLNSYNQTILYNEESGAIEVATKLDPNTKVDFKFYTPVRFESDSLEYTGDCSPNYVVIDNLALKEVIL